MSENNWTPTPLGEILEIKYGKDHKHLANGEFPVYGSGGIMRYAEKPIYDKPSILIPRKGTLSNLFYVDKPFWSVDTMFYTKIDETNNSKFIYYFLKTLDLAALNVGSAVPSLTTEVLNNVEIKLPNRETQDKIASILSSLDDKIELNNQMNQTLEQIAQAIFKEWFVDFNFPGFDGNLVDGLPKGWRKGKIVEEFNLTMGQSPKGESLNIDKEGIIFYQGRTDYGFRFPQPRVYTTSPTRFANQLDTLVCVRAPVGDINMAIDKCCVGRGLAAIMHKKKAFSYTLYLMKYLEPVFKTFEKEGTVFGAINKAGFENIEHTIPSFEIISLFEKTVNVFDEKIIKNSLENEQLIEIRNSLIPRLLSGNFNLN